MPLEVRQVERSDIADIAKMDQLIMADVGITRAIWKIQEEEGDDITYSFMRFISMGMEHNSQSFWKVVDTDTDEMISVAKFTFQYHEGEAYQDTPVEGEAPPPKRLLEFFGQINKVSNEFAKQNYAGRPHARTCLICRRRRVRVLTIDCKRSRISRNTSTTSKAWSSAHAARTRHEQGRRSGT